MGEFAEMELMSSIDELIDPDNGRPPIPRATSKICRYCGEDGFTWQETPDGWRLAKAGEVHTCKQYQPNS